MNFQYIRWICFVGAKRREPCQRSFPSTPHETHGRFDRRGYRPVPSDCEEQDRRSFFLFRML